MNQKSHRAIIVSGPSGAGKTTIAKYLLKNNADIGFSVSACTRPRRPHEIHGEDYYFLSLHEFKQKIAQGEFIEWEEVHTGNYYGTLKKEVQNIWAAEKVALFDIDVQGGLRLKSHFKRNTLAIYVGVPSLQALAERLRSRATESEENITVRLSKVHKEAFLAPKFDVILINETLQESLANVQALLDEFLKT